MTRRPRRRLWLAIACSLAVVLAALWWHQGFPGQHAASPALGPGLTEPVGPGEFPCDGVSVLPTEDLQQVVDSNSAGTTFCIAGGTHRLARPLVPRAGDAFIGRPGAVISGSKVLTGWRRTGTVWFARGFLPREPGDHGPCRQLVLTCTYTEDVFLDKRRLARVGAPSAVRAGTVHADYHSNTITIADDPRGHLVEQAVARSLIRASVDGVTVANLVLEEAANEAQVGAVESRREGSDRGGVGWRLLHNEVRLNHGVGLGFAGGATVMNNAIHHQGQLGFGAGGVGSLVSNNEIAFNGTAGYSPEWEAGGSKLWETERLRLTHNDVHDNMGPGLWADGGTLDTVYENNRITGNMGAGIQHEISYDAIIRYNEVSGNGRWHKGWAWEAGIQIQSSGGRRVIEVAHNVVRGNANGITLIDSGDRYEESPAPHGRHLVRNVWVHDNTIALTAWQMTGAVQDTGDQGIFSRNGNRFEANTYELDAFAAPHFFWTDGDLSWQEWLGAGNDATGRARLVRD